jgi:hypothetical protein
VLRGVLVVLGRFFASTQYQRDVGLDELSALRLAVLPYEGLCVILR